MFYVSIQVPTGYPHRPPVVTFLTKIWHPNVSSSDGSMCAFTSEWSGLLTLSKILVTTQGIVGSPEPEDPHDVDVASQYISDFTSFRDKAVAWTAKYATRRQQGSPLLNIPVQIPRPMFWDEDAKNRFELAREHLESAISTLHENAENLKTDAYVQISNNLKNIYLLLRGGTDA